MEGTVLIQVGTVPRLRRHRLAVGEPRLLLEGMVDTEVDMVAALVLVRGTEDRDTPVHLAATAVGLVVGTAVAVHLLVDMEDTRLLAPLMGPEDMEDTGRRLGVRMPRKRRRRKVAWVWAPQLLQVLQVLSEVPSLRMRSKITKSMYMMRGTIKVSLLFLCPVMLSCCFGDISLTWLSCRLR